MRANILSSHNQITACFVWEYRAATNSYFDFQLIKCLLIKYLYVQIGN